MAREPLELLNAAKALNSKVFSLPRLELLAILSYYRPDGVEFRELKTSMGMSDGKLLSNVYALMDMGYVISEDVKVENKSLTSYKVTDEGEESWKKVHSWLTEWLEATCPTET